ncbi:MAG TPA: asparagine synthase-related protein, partial [Gemmatimonadales bacterium]|nr:asparagine synthase-related protein [Gemmatimonadales bacterium]
MSAICAIFRFDGAPVPRTALAPVLESLRGFGPEAVSWTPETPESPVALGCRPMRISPEDSHYHPPLRSADGRIVLVADARIDNRVELATSLGLSPASTGQTSDPDLILAAYEAWGRDCVRRLVGDFAFALWDQRQRWLFCARDGMGMRVLFYHLSPQRVAFATLPQALVALADVPARLNEQKVAESLVLFQDPATTFFAGIERLLPGHALTAGAGGVRTERFWSPTPTRKIRFRTELDYVEGFNEVFDRAVLARLRSTGSVGVMLSGGLDSTAVAASAAAQLAAQGRRLLAYHAAPRLGFRENLGGIWVADESPEAEAIASGYPNLDLRIHRTDGRTQFDFDEALFGMAGLPPRNPANLAWYAGLHAAACAEGVSVMLAGNHGNNTISYDGMRSLLDSARRGKWVHLLREVTAFARATGNGRRDVLREHVLLPLLPARLAAWSEGSSSHRQGASMIARYSAIRPEFAAASHVARWVIADGEFGFRTRRAGSLEHRV